MHAPTKERLVRSTEILNFYTHITKTNGLDAYINKTESLFETGKYQDADKELYKATVIFSILGSYDTDQAKVEIASHVAKSPSCGKEFDEGTLYYKCNCGKNPNNSVCISCFDIKKHQGHHYTFRLGSFCCDCGDLSTFNPEQFCDKHNKQATLGEIISSMPKHIAEKGIPILYKVINKIAVSCLSFSLLNIEILLSLYIISEAFNFIICEKLTEHVNIETNHQCIPNTKDYVIPKGKHKCACILLDRMMMSIFSDKYLVKEKLSYLSTLSKSGSLSFTECIRGAVFRCYEPLIANYKDLDNSDKISMLFAQIYNGDGSINKMLEDEYCTQCINICFQLATEKLKAGDNGLASFFAMHFFQTAIDCSSVIPAMYNNTAIFHKFYEQLMHLQTISGNMDSDKWKNLDDIEFAADTIFDKRTFCIIFDLCMNSLTDLSYEWVRSIATLLLNYVREFSATNKFNPSIRYYLLPLYCAMYTLIVKLILAKKINTMGKTQNIDLRNAIIECFRFKSEVEYYEMTNSISQYILQALLFACECRSEVYKKPSRTMALLNAYLWSSIGELPHLIGLLQIIFATNANLSFSNSIEQIFGNALMNKDTLSDHCLYMILQILCNDFALMFNLPLYTINDNNDVAPIEYTDLTEGIIKSILANEILQQPDQFKISSVEITRFLNVIVKRYKKTNMILKEVVVQNDKESHILGEAFKSVNLFNEFTLAHMLKAEYNLSSIKKFIPPYFDPLQNTNNKTMYKLVTSKVLSKAFNEGYLMNLCNVLIDTKNNATMKIIGIKILKDVMVNEDPATILKLLNASKLKEVLLAMKEKESLYQFSIDRILQYMSDKTTINNVDIQEEKKNDEKVKLYKEKQRKAMEAMKAMQEKAQSKLSSIKYEEEQESTNANVCVVCLCAIKEGEEYGGLVSMVLNTQNLHIQNSYRYPSSVVAQFDTIGYLYYKMANHSLLSAISIAGCKHLLHSACYSNFKSTLLFVQCPTCRSIYKNYVPFSTKINSPINEINILFGEFLQKCKDEDANTLSVEKIIEIGNLLKTSIIYYYSLVGVISYDTIMETPAFYLKHIVKLFTACLATSLFKTNDIYNILEFKFPKGAESPLTIVNEIISAMVFTPYKPLYQNFLSSYKAQWKQCHPGDDIDMKNYINKIRFLEKVFGIEEIPISETNIEDITPAIAYPEPMVHYNAKPGKLSIISFEDSFDQFLLKNYMKDCNICNKYHKDKMVCIVCGKQICIRKEVIIHHAMQCNHGHGLGICALTSSIISVWGGVIIVSNGIYTNGQQYVDEYMNSTKYATSDIMQEYKLNTQLLESVKAIIANGDELNSKKAMSMNSSKPK